MELPDGQGYGEPLCTRPNGCGALYAYGNTTGHGFGDGVDFTVSSGAGDGYGRFFETSQTHRDRTLIGQTK